MSRSPFILVPWQHDFMPVLMEIALTDSEHGGGLENALFIFPHARPARYLERIIREDSRIAKPCLMPECTTGSRLFQDIHDEARHPARPIGKLDRVGLLLECLRAEQDEHPGPISRIPTDDAKAFFPWGRRLASLFEECLNHGRAPESFLHMEEELMPFAAAILSRLSSLYRRYIAALESGGWTTPGFTAQNTVAALASGYKPRLLARGKNIYICGFYSLSGTEDALFKRLWLEYGAKVLLHADPALADGNEHWSCSALTSWRHSWGAGLNVLAAPPAKASQMNFYAGYDVHSQLAFLRRGIHKRGEELGRELEDTAIILPDTTLLLPVLHHIQADDVNISMGYPLSNTALQRFLEAVMALHENARDGGYYWRDCLRLLRQPYIKMLDESLDADGRNPWRELLLAAERKLRNGRRYVDFTALMGECLLEIEAGTNLEKVQQTWESVRVVCIDAWEDMNSLGKMAETLESLINLLLERGENIWPHFPIDAECLSRFATSLIPELKNSSLAREAMPRSTVFSIFHELAESERVPFDAYPLTVLQIMGLLESRLLSFKSVFILDASDDLLPGGVQSDPLLPDSLRAELGLPDAARRQRLTAYYFFRLLQSAEEVHVFWQEGVEPQGLLDAKKLRSRFVEELIWREEQKLGRRLDPRKPLPPAAPELPPLTADGPLHRIGSRLSPFKPEMRSINATPESRARLAQLLASPISATSLNRYMSCPASFYYKELAGISPTKTVQEEEDPAAVGTLLHAVLKDFYGSQLGRPLKNESLSRTGLSRLYKAAMAESRPIDDMLADTREYLGLAGERRLRDYLDNQPQETVVRALELPVSAPLSTACGKTFQLIGYLDRIDERPQRDGKSGLVILDYKTGRVKPVSPELWNAQEIWQYLENEPDLADREFFCKLADHVNDVQLPFYLYLAYFGQASPARDGLTGGLGDLSAVCNAGWVSLREKGNEIFIFSEEFSRESRVEIIEDKISLLLEYLLRHLAAAESFFARPGRSCEYCEYRDICIVLSGK